MNTAVNERLIIQAARSDATRYVDLGNAAARKLDAAFVRNAPAMTEGTYRGRADGLRSFIATLEDRMAVGSTIEIESAIRAVLQAVDNVEAFLSPKTTKVTDGATCGALCRCIAKGPCRALTNDEAMRGCTKPEWAGTSYLVYGYNGVAFPGRLEPRCACGQHRGN